MGEVLIEAVLKLLIWIILLPIVWLLATPIILIIAAFGSLPYWTSVKNAYDGITDSFERIYDAIMI